MERSEAAFLKQLKLFGPQPVNIIIGEAGNRIASLLARSLIVFDVSIDIANVITVTITDAGRAALEEHVAEEKAERERLRCTVSHTDHPKISIELLGEALGKIVETPQTEEERKAA